MEVDTDLAETIVVALVPEWLDPGYQEIHDGMTQLRVTVAWDVDISDHPRNGQYVPIRIQEKADDGAWGDGKVFRVRVTADEVSDDR